MGKLYSECPNDLILGHLLLKIIGYNITIKARVLVVGKELSWAAKWTIFNNPSFFDHFKRRSEKG